MFGPLMRCNTIRTVETGNQLYKLTIYCSNNSSHIQNRARQVPAVKCLHHCQLHT